MQLPPLHLPQPLLVCFTLVQSVPAWLACLLHPAKYFCLCAVAYDTSLYILPSITSISRLVFGGCSDDGTAVLTDLPQCPLWLQR